tara:strand:- start:17916 stop:18800 length:885 start_codon:yes stop_codon:yes gene_type:complete
MSLKPEVILVNLKNHQSYIIENIKNLLLFKNTNITIITDKDLFAKFDDFKEKVKLIDEKELDLSYFDDKNKQNAKFRNGFWPLTSRRLFCVYEYIKKYNVERCYHLENDTMVYTDLNRFADKLSDKLYITLDAPNRCIAGIMFIPKYFNMIPLIEDYQYNKNDMLNLVRFYIKHPSFCETFPIIKPNTHFESETDNLSINYSLFQGIFDAAAIGQYLGGVDPRNIRKDSRGFVNETCKVNYSKYKYKWIKKENLYVPHVEIEGEFIPIFNLHIHCKRLENFMGDNPTETKLIEL